MNSEKNINRLGNLIHIKPTLDTAFDRTFEL